MSIFPIGRKAKDQKALAAANTSGGTVTIRSKNRITNPVNPAKTLGRGSKVIVRNTPSLKIDKPTVTPGASHVNVTKQTSQIYKPGDFQGKVHDRPTTETLGRSMGENPSKTRLRMKAQGEGRTSYKTASGKEEYAGRIEKKTSYSTSISKDPDTKRMGGSQVINRKSIDVSNPVAPKKTLSGHTSFAIQRSSGVDKKGRSQNYNNVNMINKRGEKKTLIKIKTYTPGTKGRTGSTILPRKKY